MHGHPESHSSGQRHVDPGVLLNVMLTGTHPSDRIADGKAGRIVRKCTNINPANRPRSVKEFEKRL